MDPLTIVALGVKFVESVYTGWINREQAAKLKEAQRAAKREEILNNQQRDIDKFKRSCQFQQDMELENHVEKIQTIADNFLKSIELMFQKENLDSHYMLNVSPYVLQRSLIPLSVKDIFLPDVQFEQLYGKDLSKESLYNVREKLLCILSGSNNSAFNRDVLPYLDDAISEILSSHWNERSNHTIVYYEDMWNCEKGTYSHEKLENLRSSIPNATLVITPFFKPNKDGQTLVLRVNMWVGKNSGISEAEIPTYLHFDTIPSSYSLKDINAIVSRFTLEAICAIGQMTDLFYWVTEHKAPRLPYLLGKGLLAVPDSIKNRVVSDYAQWYRSFAIDVCSSSLQNNPEHQLISDLIEINQYNHPERSVAFLESLMILSKSSSTSPKLVRESVLSIYRAKTDKDEQQLNQINASLIKKEDVYLILKLIELAKDCRDENLANEIIEIIKRRIITWNN